MAWLWSGSCNKVTCFYCNSHLTLLPPASTKGKHRQLDPHLNDALAVGAQDDFWCSACGQITRKDAQTGEILSDEAAHHDPALNNDSFKLRGTAARDRLPTLFPSSTTTTRSTPFCRHCLSNQALQLHLLASYPLDESSFEDSTRRHPDSEIDPYPPLDEYRRSLDLRYPLVCAECAPAVESTIRERDYRVKAQALGWRLRETQRRREEEERRSDGARRREGRDWIVQGVVWRLRGVAWASTHVTAIAAAYSDYFGTPHPLRALIERKIGPLPVGARHLVVLFLLALLSLFWSFWDPTWNAARLVRARGRDSIVRYRGAYLAIQMIAYFARLGMVTTSLWRRQEAEPLSSRHSWAAFIVLIGSLTALMSATLIPTLQPRTPVRLQARAKSSSTSLAADSSSSTTTASFQSADPLEPLANLSLSHNGSLLVPSPPTTPTPTGTGTTRRKQSATIREQQQLSTKSRRGSFSLGLRSWRSSPSPLGVAAAATRPTDDAPSHFVDDDDDDDENFDDAGETSMDWCPTPPPASVSTSSAFASRANSNNSPSSSFSTNHVTFARQRFVPPDTRTPTGLEGMFERVVAVRDDDAVLLSGGTVPVVAGRDVEMKSVAQSTTGGGSSTWGLARWWGK